MPNLKDDGLTAISGVMLKDAYPQILEKLTKHLEEVDHDLVRQLKETFVVSQALNGTPNDFSFMAFPVPRLNFQQRQLMELQEAKSINVKFPASNIRIDLDDFGKINWFYVTNLPEMHVALQKFMPITD